MYMNNELGTDLVFQALSHQVRREILDSLRDQPGQSVGKLASGFDISRIAIMNHLTVLEKADLVISERDGRTRRLYLNLIPIQLIYERWSNEYSAYWANRLTSIKYAAEAKALPSRRKNNVIRK